MRRPKAATALLALCACSKVNPFYCEFDEDCEPGECVPAYAACANEDDACEEFGLRYDGSAGPLAGVCLGDEEDAGVEPFCDLEYCGDGYVDCLLGADPPCPAGDSALTAIDVDAGSGTVDIEFARDDFTPSCTEPGGRDAFFQFTVPVRQMVYLDTWGSDFHAVLSVQQGACPGTPIACRHDSCEDEPELASWIGTLEPGTYCAVVDQWDWDDAYLGGFHAALRLFRGPEAEVVLQSGTLGGDTCAAADAANPSCGGAGGRERVYALTTCADPRTLTAETCTTHGTFPAVLAVRDGTIELACAADCDVSASLAGPGVFWVAVDSPDATTCGAYSLTLTY